jgi:hypothetical protein
MKEFDYFERKKMMGRKNPVKMLSTLMKLNSPRFGFENQKKYSSFSLYPYCKNLDFLFLRTFFFVCLLSFLLTPQFFLIISDKHKKKSYF